MSDIPSLFKKGEHGGTLQFPNKKANQLRQSIPNKKSDKVELKVSGIFQTPHNLLLILIILFTPYQWTFMSNDSQLLLSDKPSSDHGC